MSIPTRERGKLLQRIHVQLAKLNNAELASAEDAQGAGVGSRHEASRIACSL